MEDMQLFVMIAGYALGVFSAAVLMEMVKAIVWASVFAVFYRWMRKK